MVAVDSTVGRLREIYDATDVRFRDRAVRARSSPGAEKIKTQ